MSFYVIQLTNSFLTIQLISTFSNMKFTKKNYNQIRNVSESSLFLFVFTNFGTILHELHQKFENEKLPEESRKKHDKNSDYFNWSHRENLSLFLISIDLKYQRIFELEIKGLIYTSVHIIQQNEY